MYPLNFNAIKKKSSPLGVTIATEENEYYSLPVHERLFFQGSARKDPMKLTQRLLDKERSQSPLTYSERKYMQA